MKTPRILVVVLLLAVLSFGLATTKAEAHSFIQGQNQTLFEASPNLFRLRQEQKPWQLINLPQAPDGLESVKFIKNSWFVLSRQSVGLTLFTSNDGIRFVSTNIIGVESAQFRQIGDQTFLGVKKASLIQLLRINDDGSLSQLADPNFSTITDVDRLVIFNDQVIFLRQSNLQTEILQLANDQWRSLAKINCANSIIIDRPIIGLYCQDGRLLLGQSPTSWSQLSSSVNLPHVTKDIMVSQNNSNLNQIDIWKDNKLSSFELFINQPTLNIASLGLAADRIMVRDSTGQMWEFLYNQTLPQLTSVSTSVDSQFILHADDPQIFVVDPTANYFSSSSGSWRTFTTVGDFNHFAQTPHGWLIWQTDENKQTGGLTQFADNSLAFQKVNPWSSTSSPVQALSLGQNSSFLSVITNSGAGNVNLYKTTNYIDWSRITLPTKPTYSLSISDLRTLPASSLVEVEAPISVGSGVVSSDTAYVQDQTGGIQIYLSSTKGALPKYSGKRARVTGEISTSQVKRIVLDQADDLQLGAENIVSPKSATTEEASKLLGILASLKGEVISSSTGSLTLQTKNVGLKVNLDANKPEFNKGDTVSLTALVDWNSSSGAVEGWYVDGTLKILTRAEPTIEPILPTLTVALVTPPTAKQVKKIAELAGVSASNQSISDAKLADQNKSTQVADAKSKNLPTTSSTVVLSFVSLLAGLVSSTGNRFQRLINLG